MAQPDQTKVEPGPVFEVWFAPTEDATQKSKFLVRDDAYSKQGMTVSRRVKLGQPIDLGPSGAWRQTSWEGGGYQDSWSDEAMYFRGSANTSSPRGKVTLHPALGAYPVPTVGRANVKRLILGRNALGVGTGALTNHLFFGENNNGGTAPASGFQVYRITPGFAIVNLGLNSPREVTAFSPVDDNSSAIFVGFGPGTGGGYVAAFDPFTGFLLTSPSSYVEPKGGIAPNSMAFFNNALYWCAGNIVRKRYNDGVTVHFDQLFEASGCALTQGIEVYNNRLWFGGITPSTHTRVYTSDGTTTVLAFTLPDEFELQGMKSHYGSLYMCGSRPAADRLGWIGEVWRYTGSQLKKIYECGAVDDNGNVIVAEEHTIWDMYAQGNILYWSQNARASNQYRAGLVAYDAEIDAISMGPTMQRIGPTTINSIEGYDQTMVVSEHNDGTNDTYGRPIRKGGVVRLDTGAGGNIHQQVTSSHFDADLPAEQKVWLTARVRAKIPANTSVELKYLLDDDPTERSIVGGLIAGSGSPTKYSTYTIAMRDTADNKFLKSTTIQYRLYLHNTDTANADSTANPVVDALDVQFMPSPVKRRQWALRFILWNGQYKLDGGANSLTTTTALRQKLEDLWSAQQPLKFWDISKDGSRSDGTSPTCEVMVTDFQDQPFLYDDTDLEDASEISMTLLELIQ